MSKNSDNGRSVDGQQQRVGHPQHTHEAARLIDQHQQEILELWIDAVVDHVAVAKHHTRAELGNHLQNLLDDIVGALDSVGDDFYPEKIAQLKNFGLPSTMHGRERATMKGYTVGQVVHEYVVLRHVLTSFCADHNVDDVRAIDIVAYVIEYASLTAVKEFIASMEEIQQKLIGTLVHDVRTPLGVAYNYAELLSKFDLPEERKQQAVQTITKSLKRAGSMLEDLLDTVKMEAGRGLFMRFGSADINDALATVCKEADHLYGKTTINPCLESRPVVGVFDMALVIRTVENLISNAVKFGDKKTPITVFLEDHDEYVTIRVHNRGEPIPEADVNSIFSFFSSANENKSDEKSWGLGLSLIKTVVQNHGGEVILESSAEQGTTLGMTLRKHYRVDGEILSILI